MVTLLIKALNSYLEYHKALSELWQLTDYELRDIGISRGDISYIARQQAKKK